MEVRLNILLIETKKVYYFKGHGMHYMPLLLQIDWYKQPIQG